MDWGSFNAHVERGSRLNPQAIREIDSVPGRGVVAADDELLVCGLAAHNDASLSRVVPLAGRVSWLRRAGRRVVVTAACAYGVTLAGGWRWPGRSARGGGSVGNSMTAEISVDVRYTLSC